MIANSVRSMVILTIVNATMVVMIMIEVHRSVVVGPLWCLFASQELACKAQLRHCRSVSASFGSTASFGIFPLHNQVGVSCTEVQEYLVIEWLYSCTGLFRMDAEASFPMLSSGVWNLVLFAGFGLGALLHVFGK